MHTICQALHKKLYTHAHTYKNTPCKKYIYIYNIKKYSCIYNIYILI